MNDIYKNKNREATIDNDSDYRNLKLILDTRWKYKIGMSTFYKTIFDGTTFQQDINLFGKCAIQMKRILQLEKKYTKTVPLGFLVLEIESNKFLHYHGIFTDLMCFNEIETLWPTKSGGGWTNTYAKEYELQEHTGTDWIGYICKKECKESIYYTAPLMKEVKSATRSLKKLNKQTGLIDERNIHIKQYLTKERIEKHEMAVKQLPVIQQFKILWETK